MTSAPAEAMIHPSTVMLPTAARLAGSSRMPEPTMLFATRTVARSGPILRASAKVRGSASVDRQPAEGDTKIPAASCAAESERDLALRHHLAFGGLYSAGGRLGRDI